MTLKDLDTVATALKGTIHKSSEWYSFDTPADASEFIKSIPESHQAIRSNGYKCERVRVVPKER